jgi:hypothetical protein
MNCFLKFSLVLGSVFSAAAIGGPAFGGASLPRVVEEALGPLESGQLKSGEIPQAEVLSGGRHGAIQIAPLTSRPFGRTYGEWVVAWWRWALKTPASVNPILDPDSTVCGVGDQPRHVRFIGGNFSGGANDPPVVRRCTVPAGTAFFFPILGAVWASTPAPNPGCPVPADSWYGTRPGDAGYQEFIETIYKPVGVNPNNPKGSLTLTIDGKPIAGLEKRYIRSKVFFNALLPNDNIFDALVQFDCFNRILLTPNVGYGYHVFLRPLAPGRHTIRWTAEATLPLLGALRQDVTYHVTVRSKDYPSPNYSPDFY